MSDEDNFYNYGLCKSRYREHPCLFDFDKWIEKNKYWLNKDYLIYQKGTGTWYNEFRLEVNLLPNSIFNEKQFKSIIDISTQLSFHWKMKKYDYPEYTTKIIFKNFG